MHIKIFKEVHRAIEFNQKDLLKPDIDIKTEPTKRTQT